MNKLATIGILMALLVGAVAVFLWSGRQSDMKQDTHKHLILIGASIGQAWNLAAWPQRVGLPDYTSESIPNWQFDKSEAVSEVVIRPKRPFRLTRTFLKSLLQPPPPKPDVVILKECSSYFPGDLAKYEKDIDRWVRQLNGTGATVVLATVVPVTEARSKQVPGKQEELLEYNRWVREYAMKNGLTVLDLESALRDNSAAGYLRPEFAQPDGSHLVPAAYTVLDGLLKSTVCSAGTDVCQFEAVKSGSQKVQ